VTRIFLHLRRRRFYAARRSEARASGPFTTQDDINCAELVEGLCCEAGFIPRVAQAVEQKHTMLDLVAEGLGVSIISCPYLFVRFWE
jgi:hypothetical protein